VKEAAPQQTLAGLAAASLRHRSESVRDGFQGLAFGVHTGEYFDDATLGYSKKTNRRNIRWPVPLFG
jgi:hypothetical protein